MRQITLTAVLSGLLAAGALACARHPSAYTIGVAGPWQTGYGLMDKQGVDLAVEEINGAGGINGIPLHVIAHDDHGSGADAVQIAQEFVADPDVISVVGHVGSGAMVAAARVYDGKLAAIGTSPTSPDLTGISHWAFRMVSSDSVNGVIIAKFASHLEAKLGRPPRAAVLYANDSYGRGLADAFRRSFHGQVLTIDPAGDSTDMEPYVAYYKAHAVDLVFVASTEQLGIAFLREARRQQFGAMFFGGDGWEGTTADPSSEGAYVATSFTSESPDTAVQRFVTAFKAKYNTVPHAPAALAYDATRIMAAAIAHAGPSREGVRDYIASVNTANPYHGVSGLVQFASTGDQAGDHILITRAHNGLLTVEGRR